MFGEVCFNRQETANADRNLECEMEKETQLSTAQIKVEAKIRRHSIEPAPAAEEKITSIERRYYNR
jgi:hypothetical protein